LDTFKNYTDTINYFSSTNYDLTNNYFSIPQSTNDFFI
jgi:hypothetical protein